MGNQTSSGVQTLYWVLSLVGFTIGGLLLVIGIVAIQSTGGPLIAGLLFIMGGVLAHFMRTRRG